jgi:hypothetical protein
VTGVYSTRGAGSTHDVSHEPDGPGKPLRRRGTSSTASTHGAQTAPPSHITPTPLRRGNQNVQILLNHPLVVSTESRFRVGSWYDGTITRTRDTSVITTANAIVLGHAGRAQSPGDHGGDRGSDNISEARMVVTTQNSNGYQSRGRQLEATEDKVQARGLLQ